MKVITIAARRARAGLHPHPQRAARHRRALRRARRDRRPAVGSSSSGGRAARRDARLPARPALRRHLRLLALVVVEQINATERHRPHDHARLQLRPDRRHRRRPRRLRRARPGRRRRRPPHRKEGARMATHAGGLRPWTQRGRRRRRGPRPAPQLQRGGRRAQRSRPRHRGRASSWPCSGRSRLRQVHAAARAGRTRPRRRRARDDRACPTDVSVVFQDSRLLPWERVLDNVVLGLRRPRRRATRGREALAEVGLAGREKAWPHELSGGEQQRVALARSLVREPGAAAGRRAVRRARRADPDQDARAAQEAVRARTAPPCCWSPTTWTRRSCWPTG